jgi:hypothetical protein
MALTKIQGSGISNVTISADGEVTKAAQPAFSVIPTNPQTNLAVGTTDVVFGTEIYDVGANFASNTFTAPVTGKYQLSYSMYTNSMDSAAAYVYFQITTSNRGYFVLLDPDFGQDAVYWTFTISVLADMDANDTAKVQFNQSGGTAQQDVLDGSFFTGVLIC